MVFSNIQLATQVQQFDTYTECASMLMIEAAKDEYARDHPGATQTADDAEFRTYFRFGVPRCPLNPNESYQDWNVLGTRASCKVHGTIENLQAMP